MATVALCVQRRTHVERMLDVTNSRTSHFHINNNEATCSTAPAAATFVSARQDAPTNDTMSTIGRRRARPRPTSVHAPVKTSTMLATLLLWLNQVNAKMAASPVQRGLAVPMSVDSVALSLAAAGEEGSAVCNNSKAFLGVGNTACMHENLRTAAFLLAVIVAVSIGFERLIHFIRGVITCPQLRKIVNRIFEEVMIMGFLSMVIFTLNTSGAMKSLAINALTASEQLHFYEFFHYIVFLTMIYFILIVLLLLFIGTVVPKLIWKMTNHPGDRDESTDDIQDNIERNNFSSCSSFSSRDDSHRMRHSFIRDVSSLGRDLNCQSTGSAAEGTMDTPSEDVYTAIHTHGRVGDGGAYRTAAVRARALSGMDLVLGSRAYSLLQQRYQREGWWFRFNFRKQWNLWKSFEVLAYNICQNRSGYLYKNPVEMERLFGVRSTPPVQPWDQETAENADDANDEKYRMTYAKYHVLCMRNLLYHMTNIHPSAFLILIVICLLPAIFPSNDHWIFLGVGGLLLLVNVVIFFKVLKILRGIVDDRLNIITMRDIQKRLEKALKVSERRGRRRWPTISATDSTPAVSVDESTEDELNPAVENLQSFVQARRKKGPRKFKAAALAVRAVIRMQMSALCHQQLHYHDNRFWFNSPRLLLRLFQFATIGQAFYLVWFSLVEAQSASGASAWSGGGSGFLAVMVIFPVVALFVITPLTMPSLVLVMSLTGIFVDLNANNGEDGQKRHNVTREEAKTHMRLIRRSFLRSHYTSSGIQKPQVTSPTGPIGRSDSASGEQDAVASPTNVFLRIYDSPSSSANARRSRASYYQNNTNSVGRHNGSLGRNNSLGQWLRGHSRSVGSIGSASGAADDVGYGSSRRAFNLAAFQSMGGALPTTNDTDNQTHSQSAYSYSSCRTPRPTKMADISAHGGPAMSWSQADVETESQVDNNASNADNTQDDDVEQPPSSALTSFKAYCSKYGGYPDL